eukprot:CAMPEP_0113818696 /NCGR_PEP_ID=MMETSP0328-20130328/369_1 /TAXON_ID=39455 /ORGANISM="Alexandrium minutum" /LENGTH=140 /DNA_ID=CAMNT_0000786631 /DNA_START=95 /DNA_END=517 /DNA_ORIENTATION=- /assembly_acc=CAM_ASM_000350
MAVISLIDFAGDVVVQTAGPRTGRDLQKDARKASGRTNACRLSRNSGELVQDDETIGSHEDTLLTIVWYDRVARDIWVTREALHEAKKQQALIEKHQQELSGARALLERARERQQVLLSQGYHAAALVRNLNSALGSADA